jgi:hypothetical protein
VWWLLLACRDAPDEGKWFLAPATPASDADDEIRRLEALGYAAGTEPASAAPTGVLRRTALAEDGVNLVVSGHGPQAALVDMDGRTVHTWHVPFATSFPDDAPFGMAGARENFRRASVSSDGGLVFLHEGVGIVAVDAESRVRWARANRAHHDLDLRPDGTVWTLTRKAQVVPAVHAERPILEDFAVHLDESGNTLAEVSIVRAMLDSAWKDLVHFREGGDVFHTNTIRVLDGRHVAIDPAFAAGNLLVSLRHADTVAVIDPVARRAVWAQKGPWRRQHDPLLDHTGRVVVFDNIGGRWGRSRVVAIDPTSREVAWQWDDHEALRSRTLGALQELDNGNLLVVESERGRAVEITPSGEVVWEYANPHRAGQDDRYVAAVFDVVRYPPSLADAAASWRSRSNP